MQPFQGRCLFVDQSQGSSVLADCHHRNPYMSACMISMTLGDNASHDLKDGVGVSVQRSSPEGSVASRRGRALDRVVANLDRANVLSRAHALVAAFGLSFCSFYAGKKMRPTPLRKRSLAARASSCNPRSAFGQPVAQPEPRTPGAPNSNRCQSGSPTCQLVFVRMS